MLKRFGVHLLSAILVVMTVLSIGSPNPPLGNVSIFIVSDSYIPLPFLSYKLTHLGTGFVATGESDGDGYIIVENPSVGDWQLEVDPDSSGTVPSNAQFRPLSQTITLDRTHPNYDWVNDSVSIGPLSLSSYDYFLHLTASDIATSDPVGDVQLVINRQSGGRTITTYIDSAFPTQGTVVGVDPVNDSGYFEVNLTGSLIADKTEYVAHAFGVGTEFADFKVNTSRSDITLELKNYDNSPYTLPAGVIDAIASCEEISSGISFSAQLKAGDSSITITVVPGTYSCSVTVKDHFSSVIEGTVSEETSLTLNVSVLERSADIRLSAVDDLTGDPLPVAMNYLLTAKQGSMIPDSISRANIMGDTLIKALSGTEYVVSATFADSSGGYLLTGSQLAAPSNAYETIIEFRLSPQTERLTVEVRDPDGGLLPQGTVEAVTSNGSKINAAISSGQATLYLLKGVDYTVRAYPVDGERYLPSAAAPVTLTTDSSISLAVVREQRKMEVTVVPEVNQQLLQVLSTDCTATYTATNISIHQHVQQHTVAYLPLSNEDQGEVSLFCYLVGKIEGRSLYLEGETTYVDSGSGNQSVQVSLNKLAQFVEEQTYSFPEETGRTFQFGSGLGTLAVPANATSGEGTVFVKVGSGSGFSNTAKDRVLTALNLRFFLEQNEGGTSGGNQPGGSSKNGSGNPSDADLQQISRLRYLRNGTDRTVFISHLEKAALLTIKVDQGRLAELGRTNADVRAAVFDTVTGRWNDNVPQSFNPDSNTMTVAVTRSSVWGLLVSLANQVKKEYVPKGLSAGKVVQIGKIKGRLVPYQLIWTAPNSAHATAHYTLQIASVRERRSSRDERRRKKKRKKKKGKKGKKKKGKKKEAKKREPAWEKNSTEYTIPGNAGLPGGQISFVVSLPASRKKTYYFRVRMLDKPFSEEVGFKVVK